ncbi:hypothetical protein JANAI62_14490 [Jannaschia pagri]|uniref:Antitoxin Xre/MbcA/ParS-like toxin-binding domain-containing protein n=1 Tax=Jannaschia pagri TaxID=2829797 RepID=A0ABQ4NKA9_9RHOB|nr:MULTISPECIES: hypothetical protein [unclassified Jannaschia]GIT90994.1 hypothetical protein JANAI61_14520 [Jannaschia sp. AI_61]GIT94826.1 hypothetical protein JANAI62_14490 [Jannaschia sp. AI_62]
MIEVGPIGHAPSAPNSDQRLELPFVYNGAGHVVTVPTKSAEAFARAFIAVLIDLQGSFPRIEDAINWINTVPLPGYGDDTARDLLEQGRGRSVLNYLDAFRRGAHA